jgi:beta-lactamase regulating signal transducer with metallopeptidase domain
MMAIDFQTLAQVSAGRVLNTMSEGVALAGLSWLVLRWVGGRSAVTRFAVWFSTLLAVVSLPLLARTSSSAGWRKPELELSSAWAKDLFIAWAAIASVLLIRLAGSLWHVRRLRREGREIDAREHAELAETLRENIIGREVALLVSDEVRIPTALGFLRPAIVLPAWALHELSSEELKVILLHELAHLRRWDSWTNLAQKFLKAVFFFHPAVWWIEGRLELEREMACDNMVLEQTANPARYAASLVSIAEKALAEKTKLRRTLALAQGALGRMRQNSLRIAQILDPRRSRTNTGWRTAVAAVAGIVAVAFVAAPYVPQVISFQQQPEVSAATRSLLLPAVASMPEVQVQLAKTSEGVSERAVSNTDLAGEGPIRLRSGQVRATLQPPRPAVIPASLKEHHAARPHIVLGKANAGRADVVLAKASAEQRPASVLLFVQSTEIDPSGSVVWRLCIWRMNPGDQGARQIEETIVMHRI